MNVFVKQRSYSEWFSLIVGWTICLQLIFPKLIAPILLLLVGMVIAGIVKKQLVFQWNAMMICFVLLYVAYAIGCFFTHHWDWAAHYLTSKLSFVVFPVLFSFRMEEKFLLQPVVIGLVVANSVLLVIGLTTSFAHYAETHNAFESFTSTYLSTIHHPTYFAVFNVITLAGCWFGYFRKWKGFNGYTLTFFTLFSLIVHVLCLSLAGLLFIMLLIAVFMLYQVAKKFGKLALVGTIIAVPVLLVNVFLFVPSMRTEVKELSSSVAVFVRNPSKYVFSKPGYKTGGEVRLIMWTTGTLEFLQHPMGVGTGNVDEYLNYRLYHSNQKELIPKAYNPHNQYIQTGVEIGFIGLAILIALLVSGWRFAWKHDNWVLLVCIAGFAFNCLFESMLQRNSGIIFFAWISCVLVFYSNAGKKSGNHAV